MSNEGDVQISGTVARGFEKVRDAFEENFRLQDELGACFAAYKDGEKVVDLWGGYKDREKKIPWTEDTLINVWSTTKGMAALTIARLVDQGLIDYNAPLASYWPEFGAHGKDKVTVAQVLSHQAGVSAVDAPITIEDYFDAPRMAKLIAETKPMWEPGTRNGYHALTYGWITGELVKRVTGKTLGTVFREEFAEPLGADIFIGLPESEEYRVAEQVGFKEYKPFDPKTAKYPSAGATQEEKAYFRTIVASPEYPEASNLREWRASEIPSAGGQANALGLAKVYATAANGGSFLGRRYLSKEVIEFMSSTQVTNTENDINLQMPIPWACGFMPNIGGVILGPNVKSFGHAGWGGSVAGADPDAHLSFAYAMNRMKNNAAGDPRSLGPINALFECL